jgi:acetylglutamate kinase
MNELLKNALSYIKKFKGKTFVIKYGGSIMKNENSKNAFMEDIALLKLSGINVVIVHGGGPNINEMLGLLNIESNFVNGLRVTDERVMKIAEMVLSGSINKEIAGELSRRGISAIGISGVDGNLIEAQKKYLINKGEKIDIGFVGEVVSINTALLKGFLADNIVPVISPIGIDMNGNRYNINADYAAAAVGGILRAEKLIFMTDVEGVYLDINDKDTLIHSITPVEIREYIKCGIINGGMIPKMECCLRAIEEGAKNVHLVDGRKEHGLILNVYENSGTEIIANGGSLACQRAM